VEVVKNGKPAPMGQEGEMVITNLHSDAAPLIRYASGDVGVLGAEKCSCGRKLPLLKSIHGRLVDFIMRPDGHMLSPYVVTCAVEDVPGVQQFQVVQKKPGEVIVRLVSPPSQAVMDEVQSAVASAMGGDTRVNVEKVSALAAEPNGKFKVVKSQVGAADAVPVTS
jgi:phenylacetate-CoA ligase